ncbi:hypothetical protein [Pseudoalteromonas denitrificans]|uniref:Dienelactone hydrolase n=1 Tax=Pseudoalteromonas denitrificans DSM 6059 TaxID=1123010 RepID=A0A1I1IMS4_9GAMM|nr:hypothetical protein [Pseudoalteromonas denitrificans]SFC37544.1 hypothetical protein SAMN02745724_01540 [Pseudoalteromonas denitrificans DSM 6059]
MKLIIAPDIFGNTPELKHYAKVQQQALTQKYNKDIEVIIVDPYEGLHFEFATDTRAYEKFLAHGGHEHYLTLIKNVMAKNLNESINFIGFSAGASAIWRALDNYNTGTGCQFIGFYPSQIRNNLDINLNIETHLIFPKSEAHFDVINVMKVLEDYELVKISHTEYQHGFMNRASNGYDEIAFNNYKKLF